MLIYCAYAVCTPSKPIDCFVCLRRNCKAGIKYTWHNRRHETPDPQTFTQDWWIVSVRHRKTRSCLPRANCLRISISSLSVCLHLNHLFAFDSFCKEWNCRLGTSILISLVFRFREWVLTSCPLPLSHSA